MTQLNLSVPSCTVTYQAKLEIVNIEVPIPLDDDGFLDRQCPTCSRQFRWLPSDSSEPPPDGRYGCPYCLARNDPGDFWTEEQAEFLVDQAGQALLTVMESDGWEVRHTGSVSEPGDAGTLTSVFFLCHPGEPVKVYADWVQAGQPVACLICGGLSGP